MLDRHNIFSVDNYRSPVSWWHPKLIIDFVNEADGASDPPVKEAKRAKKIPEAARCLQKLKEIFNGTPEGREIWEFLEAEHQG